MALHGEIRVNGQTIGAWEAIRQSTEVAPTADAVLTYDCVVHQTTTLEGNPSVLERFNVEHRFGDGALALVAKILGEAHSRSATKTRL